MSVGVLAEFEPIYERLGNLGWGQDEVDRWDISIVTRFMGSRDLDLDPVIRGNRGLSLPSDGDGDRPSRPRKRRRRKTTGRPSRVLRGEDAR